MKFVITGVLMLLGGIAHAANPYAGMGPADQQRMMMAVQKMKACMEGIPQQEMDELKRRGEAMHADLKRLCAAGRRRQALSKAMRYVREINALPALVKMQKCTAEFRKVMPGGMPGGMGSAMGQPVFRPPVDEKGQGGADICSNL